MITRPLIVTVAVVLLSMTAAAQVSKTKVVFFGDSITEAGAKPGGYIAKLQTDATLTSFEFTGAGVGGNKVYDLYLRMDADVLSKKPDVVVIYIGINDIWHKRTHGTGTDLDKFGKFYEAIVLKLKEAKIVPVVCTPSVLGERTGYMNEQDGDLNSYSDWIRGFAKKNDLAVVDLRKAFVDYDTANNPESKVSGILTTDRVHLTDRGNELVAREMKRVFLNVKARAQ